MVLLLARKLFAFLSSAWALADIVLDTVTVVRYRDMCQVGIISWYHSIIVSWYHGIMVHIMVF